MDILGHAMIPRHVTHYRSRQRLEWLLALMMFRVAMASMDFRSVLTSDGFTMCAVDNPSSSLSIHDIVGIPFGVPDKVRCSYACTEKTSTGDTCLAFNVINSKCQFYSSAKNHCFAASKRCAYAQVVCDREENDCVEPKAQSCSFPFTLNGELNYKCAANNTGTACDIGCYLTGRVWATCTYESIDVTINGNTVVSLMNVNGWLIIMSRVNSSFPLNQPYSAYQTGFGEITSNFWLGLTEFYALTNPGVNGGRNYRLRFELQSGANKKWYSEEYDWVYIDGPSVKFILHVSVTATGDAGDVLNDNGSPSNGKPFVVTGTICSNTRGPSWYTSAGLCCHWNMFGPVGNNGFYWNGSEPGQLSAARIMVKH